MAFDEIKDDDNLGEDEEHVSREMGMGSIRACENLTHLPIKEKERITKEVLTECMEKLMKTYLSVGLAGEAVLGAVENFSGKKFKLHFKALRDGETDEHFDSGGL